MLTPPANLWSDVYLANETHDPPYDERESEPSVGSVVHILFCFFGFSFTEVYKLIYGCYFVFWFLFSF